MSATCTTERKKGKYVNDEAPCQCNWTPMDNDGQIVQHNDRRWNNALHEEAEQSDKANPHEAKQLKNLVGNYFLFSLMRVNNGAS